LPPMPHEPAPPALAPAPAPAPAAPGVAALDAMFGEAAPAEVTADAPAPDRGAELATRLRAAFAADLPRRRAELDAALAGGDLEAAGRVLHGLRGSAAYLGHTALGALCAELEAAADAGHLPRLLAGIGRLQSQLDAYLAS
ncbi:Hpt domain-containing protein, partial [Halobellus sp. Atlit-31R]